jgi:hypothetical protein
LCLDHDDPDAHRPFHVVDADGVRGEREAEEAEGPGQGDVARRDGTRVDLREHGVDEDVGGVRLQWQATKSDRQRQRGDQDRDGTPRASQNGYPTLKW